MTREHKAALARCASRLARTARRPGPALSADATSAQVEQWLQWNDPNGAHTAEAAASQGADRYEGDEAWDALALMLADETLTDGDFADEEIT